MSRCIRVVNGLEIPPKVSLEISAACTRKCPWCPQGDHPRKQALMPMETIEKVVHELYEGGFDGSIGLHLFNEPLADARLEDIIKKIRSIIPNADLYFHTNGDLLTPERLRSLLSAGLNGMSVNHYDPESQVKFAKFWSEITDDEKTHIKARKFKHHHIYNRAGLVATKRQVPLQRQCRRMRQMCINYLGNVVLCCNDFLGQVSVGNVNDKNVIELFNDPLMKHYRELLRVGRRAELPLCDKCDLFG